MFPIEPSADIRSGAIQVRALFLAYVEAGFTEEQALDLLKTHIAAAGTAT